jgi:hypothetical protein
MYLPSLVIRYQQNIHQSAKKLRFYDPEDIELGTVSTLVLGRHQSSTPGDIVSQSFGELW